MSLVNVSGGCLLELEVEEQSDLATWSGQIGSSSSHFRDFFAFSADR
jgi:hypothetical protein